MPPSAGEDQGFGLVGSEVSKVAAQVAANGRRHCDGSLPAVGCVTYGTRRNAEVV
jgi:hypothetical protein